MKVSITGKVKQHNDDWYFETDKHDYSGDVLAGIDEILDNKKLPITEDNQIIKITIETN